ncbi:ABC-2 type transport system permease protein [Parabacteroides sp. PF5-5]|uniref:ABC transporter permease n=1 Tax=unclassified Parabacteroides TaxID=2649774 RepID=UPI00247409EC|nr:MULTISPECIES: ABC transporter permease [unclassified Parabacteroides]MDH6305675.1 ABC-2 type transport system permease protein [Parabacteroides sp. PH5-39]MDH6316747.1 ABC-2 type transport system permease protein [Parabacteroides sp. PF5-13]MDH6320388.1 ABC-2 type transport system permease protein [Parabacteroides sp. PH5-13]MDH6324118.1 ABC-2 type transport system permease protein [Parabacteroides sp. PH5-8]MDH6327933.1 ABC-2 type transport system permease protein [Parabacteroides sp. PH5-
MSKLGIIIKREYLRRVTKKSFLVVTILMPFLMAALVFVPLWLATIKSDEVKTVAVIDATGKYSSLFEDTESFRFINSDKSLEGYRNGDNKEVYAFLNITDDLLLNPKAATLYSEKQIPGELSRLVNQTIGRKLEDEKLASFNIPNLKEIIADSKISFNVQTIKWSADGKEGASSAALASIIGMIFTLIVYMFIMAYGSMVMQGVMEEKTNRIVEVMISSVRPFELMMGKIIGIAFVGLTQIFLWGIMTSALLTVGGLMFGGGMDMSAMQQPNMAAMQPGMNMAGMEKMGELMGIINSINFMELGIFFILYFIGGYLLYASVFAAIGSSVDQQEDTNQFMAPIMIFMIFALYAGIYSMDNPDGPLAFWCSMIPFTSPVVMMIRLPFDVPMWELLLSVGLLFATALSITWLSAKIYRVGILMYGKKPSIKEMIKWLKY